jgi:hypothetical protein
MSNSTVLTKPVRTVHLLSGWRAMVHWNAATKPSGCCGKRHISEAEARRHGQELQDFHARLQGAVPDPDFDKGYQAGYRQRCQRGLEAAAPDLPADALAGEALKLWNAGVTAGWNDAGVLLRAA